MAGVLKKSHGLWGAAQGPAEERQNGDQTGNGPGEEDEPNRDHDDPFHHEAYLLPQAPHPINDCCQNCP